MYSGQGRCNATTGAWQRVLQSWASTPNALAVSSDGSNFFSPDTLAGALVWARPSYQSVTGWEALALATGLDQPAGICGVQGGSVYIITGGNTTIR